MVTQQRRFATAVMTVVVLVLGSLLPATGAQATMVFVPGTGNPTSVGVPPHHGPTKVVRYPAAPPVVGDYPGSVHHGNVSLNHSVRNSPPYSEVAGYSQGAQVVREWAATHPQAARQSVLYTVGDPCTEGTGIVPSWNVAQWAVARPCHRVPPGVHMVVINRPEDPIGNFPKRLDNGVAIANALAGYDLDHGNYRRINVNAPGARSYTVGNVTYVTLPAHKDPALVRWLARRGIHLSPQDKAAVRSLVGPVRQTGPKATVMHRGPAAKHPAAAEVPVQSVPVVASVPVQPTPAAATPEPVMPAYVAPAPVDAVVAQVKTALPPEAAPVVDQVANMVKQSPAGPAVQQLLGSIR